MAVTNNSDGRAEEECTYQNMLAAGEDSRYSHHDTMAALMISEGRNLADRLNAHFMTSNTSLAQKASFYNPFFKEVFEKKSEIEQALADDDDDASGRLDSGEGTLERPMVTARQHHMMHGQHPGSNQPRRQPQPPPR